VIWLVVKWFVDFRKRIVSATISPPSVRNSSFTVVSPIVVATARRKS
jgi:hypothetical protein